MAVRYFRSSIGCGSGSTLSFIKLEEDNKVTLILYSAWMGSPKDQQPFYKFEGEYLHIDGPYGLFKITKETNMKTGETCNVDICFDSFLFEKELATEWGQHQDKVILGIYIAGGVYFTQTFSLQIHVNKNINDDHDKLSFAIKLLDGLKYEKCLESDYDQMKRY
ncbi:MAG: hypothetical protein Barrevirus11_16 [Barrevirus sp.]|uniref:Uncharacterized protein n=1 Tax=Barrevirus sp. TaxID=2487763 RepID=A0A3G4ZQB6_9VIRU|nr:MAG: hypothetical protein Barrevirus11_16 [Barrevirus sp.]